MQKLKETIEAKDKQLTDLRQSIKTEKEKIENANEDMNEYKKQKGTMDQILIQRDKEIAKLTEEIRKIKSTSENEIKKMKKQFQTNVPMGNGSGFQIETELQRLP